MYKIDHLRRETRILSVENYCKLLTAQFAASIHDPNRHCNDLLTKPTYKRNKTLFTFARNCEETYEIDMKILKVQNILQTKFAESSMKQ